MPTSPPSRCHQPGCPHVTPCPDHQRTPWAGAKQRQARLPGDWKRRRAAQLRGHPLCAICGAAAVTVDHRTPTSQGGTSNPDNLQSLCAPCHQAKTAAEAADARRLNRP